MSNETPTDALRLDEAQRTAIEHAAMDANADVWRHCRLAMVADGEIVGYPCFSRADMAELARLYEAAPASPLPGGGDMDWQDKAEGLEADLRQAVLVAWKRGAEEWCRLNYPQWVEWLEACHAPAAPTGEPK